MIETFLDVVIGAPGRQIVAFYFANQTACNLVLLAWMAVVGYGELNLRRLSRQTDRLILEAARDCTANRQLISVQALYRRIQEDWQTQVASQGVWIPGRLGFWIERASPEKITHKLRFSPEYVEKVLTRHHVLPAPARPGR
jgi:hypothetical protein